MARSEKRKSRRRQLRASHQKNWLIGRYAVTEALRAARWPFEELYLADSLTPSETAEAERLADEADIRARRDTTDRLTELCSADHHQGFAARMAPFPYETPRQLRERLQESSSTAAACVPVVVVCDRIQDTFNFGAILRSCDATNVAGILIGPEQQAGVTPQVARSSAGAVHHLPIAMAENIVDCVIEMKTSGFKVVAASEKAEESLWACDLSGPTVLVMGSEARGVSTDLLAVCDVQVNIPMQGSVHSLNASVAAGILLYEIRRQQQSRPLYD
ncbi:MAG: 23S rRNA (guanosine(2251)-2'-O)-methyltransferase RlmB [Fuerstiella sp.]|jgi:23S rRNA (guanosine2251-2'-O)-methyltransferase|nr:23S rRNA (guanosine(2251)-2'-O)-methyltransferase RlmB [Fuerstiella sp.]MDG2131274.1 23S rRNA (guanosine(2251)-2'-O)-methyltransferase RlmB [Fuerstiella sp.]